VSDDRTELLRTQAVQACLTAMGAANVQAYGRDDVAGGIVLDTEDTLTSHTLWWINEERWRYEVTVRVNVTRRVVGRR
jgi:hypothetical protein